MKNYCKDAGAAFCTLIFFSVIFICCNKVEAPALYIPPKIDTITYVESDADFANPERGFYRYSATNASAWTPLELAQLKNWRTLQPVDGADYKIYSTLVFRYIVLDGLTSQALPDDLLDKIKKDFSVARQAGVKLIPRFTYTITANAGTCPEGFNCPPYGDAPKTIVLQHINQLKPVLQENADVIACLQMGFIGTWGENYYTDYFGDASQNAQGKLMDNNWNDRVEVLKTLLDALPADRMVQVRFPQLKQRMVYGVNAPASSAALTPEEAFKGSYKSRIGLHNDCFLASADDYGTYDDYGNNSSPRQSANTILRKYAEEDNKYGVTGGETCDDTYSPYNDCETAGQAQTEMRKMHYSYLNSAYNNAVNNDWETGGCMQDIKKNLGYRLVLQKSLFPSGSVEAGKRLKFSLQLENKGYASPFNERPVKIIFRHAGDSKEFSYTLPHDLRTWYSGKVNLDVAIDTDAAMPEGKYELFLYLPDKYESITKRPEYAIRLANENTWEETTGYNKLNMTITVQ